MTREQIALDTTVISQKVIDRVLSRCVFDDPPDDPLATTVEGPCWVWNGKRSGTYGSVWVVLRRGQVSLLTHRVMLAGSGMALDGRGVVDHLCRNRLCCNPSHLEAVTRLENVRRGSQPRHIVAGVCADCGSSRGRVRWRTWRCLDCQRRKAKERRDAIKREVPIITGKVSK